MKPVDRVILKLHSIFTKDQDSMLYAILKSISQELELIDPFEQDYAGNFSVSKAYGSFLDLHGLDYNIARNFGESDTSYRNRILSKLISKSGGPTVAGMKAIVRTFTSEDPILFDSNTSCFVMGETIMGDIIFIDSSRLFSFEVHVRNPNNVAYIKAELEAAIDSYKPAFSTATIFHQGGV